MHVYIPILQDLLLSFAALPYIHTYIHTYIQQRKRINFRPTSKNLLLLCLLEEEEDEEEEEEEKEEEEISLIFPPFLSRAMAQLADPPKAPHRLVETTHDEESEKESVQIIIDFSKVNLDDIVLPPGEDFGIRR